MINITSPVTATSAADLTSSSSAKPLGTGPTFADYLADTRAEGDSQNPSTGSATVQGVRYLLNPASASPPAYSTGDQQVSAEPTEATGYSLSSTPPYFTPAPDQTVTVTPSNGATPFQVDSMDSYLQKFIQGSVSDMYSFVSGTQGWANGGSSAITANFIAMVQQRSAEYPSMATGIDPVALGTKYANVFMQVLSSVPVSTFGPTNFTGSVLDFLTKGGSPPPTVLNQVPAVLNQPTTNTPSSVAPSPSVSGEQQVSAEQPATTGSVSSTPPYFTPAPDQTVTVTPSNGATPFQVDSMDSYLQNFIQGSVSDMYSFVSGTQGWANGGSSAITANFIAMVQQRSAEYPSIATGIDPVAMGTKYANEFMQVLSNVPVSSFGPTSFTGSILDFLTQGGSPPPTALNEVPAVLNQALSNS